MEDRSRVLLTLAPDVLSEARVLAGKATATLRLPVSLQIVLRALIEEGLKPRHRAALLATVEAHANAIQQTRRLSRRRPAPKGVRRRA